MDNQEALAVIEAEYKRAERLYQAMLAGAELGTLLMERRKALAETEERIARAEDRYKALSEMVNQAEEARKEYERLSRLIAEIKAKV